MVNAAGTTQDGRPAGLDRWGGASFTAGSRIAVLTYDGLGRRIVKSAENSGDWKATYHYYYNGQSMIEERNESDQTTRQYVWGTQYIDELAQIGVNQDPANASTQNPANRENLCERFFSPVQDANYNVLAALRDNGTVAERYEYSPYQKPIRRRIMTRRVNGWAVVAFVLVALVSTAGRAQGGEKLSPFDRPDSDRLRDIRQRFQLGAGNLASLGLSGEQAEGVLKAAREWFLANKESLTAAEQAASAAGGELQAAVTKMNVGPDPKKPGETAQQLSAEVLRRQEAYHQAQKAVYEKIAALVPVVEAKLTAEQLAAWRTMRANAVMGAVGAEVFAPNLTAEQVKALGEARQAEASKLAAAKNEAERTAATAEFRQAEQRILTTEQKQAMAAAAERSRNSSAAVAAAEAAVLPPPAK